jgi:hypothetical protein
MQNTSSQSTVGEMQEQFAEYFAKMDPTKPAVWKISVTGIDPCKKGS